MTAWHHPACFTLPRKFSSSGTTPDEFVAGYLADASGEILPEKAAELADAIASKPAKKAKGGEGGGDGEEVGADKGEAILEKLKAAFEAREGDDAAAAAEEPAAKKVKRELTDGEGADGGSTVQSAKVDAYAAFHKSSNGILQDILHWNRQCKGTGMLDRPGVFAFANANTELTHTLLPPFRNRQDR